MERIDLAQDTNKWWTLVNMVINLSKCMEYLDLLRTY
jgi:hypothetical protein